MTTEPRDLITVGCGAGTQSEAIYYMVRDGWIERPDHVIFADTGGEDDEVYAKATYLQNGYEALGIPFHVVSRFSPVTDIHDDVLNPRIFATIPAFTVIERTVRRPLTWQRCTCEWAKVFGIGGTKSVTNLGWFAPGTTLDEINHHADFHIADADCSLCSVDRDDVTVDDRKAVLHLTEAGLAAVPAPHTRCRSVGRIATSFHTYVEKKRGRVMRQCTGKYKIEPIERKIRSLLGAREWDEPCRWCDATGVRVPPWQIEAGEGPCSVCNGTGARHRVDRAPKGAKVRHIIGFSADEFITRVSEVGFPSHTTPIYPLNDLGVTREMCEKLIRKNGQTPVRSACTACPNHGNKEWRDLKQNRPEAWAKAVAFDEALRAGRHGMDAQRFVHHSFTPLAEADLSKPSRAELASAQGNLLELLENGSGGCSPYGCGSSDMDAYFGVVDLAMPTTRSGTTS